MSKYFTQFERELALERAIKTINKRNQLVAPEFVVKYNDCFALLCSYDEHLRGYSSPIYQTCKHLDWDTPVEYLRALRKSKLTITSLLTKNNYSQLYEIKDKRPQLGDIAYYKGSVQITDSIWWYSANQTGVFKRTQTEFLEPHLVHLYRPLRGDKNCHII